MQLQLWAINRLYTSTNSSSLARGAGRSRGHDDVARPGGPRCLFVGLRQQNLAAVLQLRTIAANRRAGCGQDLV